MRGQGRDPYRVFFLAFGFAIPFFIKSKNLQIIESKITVEKELEAWLHDIGGDRVYCNFEPISILNNTWFERIIPDNAPNFTLLSAWLKTESASAMKAPESIPEMYKSDFTMGNKIPVHSFYLNQVYLGKTAATSAWSEELLAKNLKTASKRGAMKYGTDGLQIHDGVARYKDYVENKRGIVIGSEDPWVEAILLHHGARHILTVEFGRIASGHPQIDTMVPKEFTEKFLNNDIDQFDFGISFSSLEHDGLGRYGDVLNPIGDLQSMAKMLSTIKPGGLFFLGVPVVDDGKDALFWNAHRIYGAMRLPKMFAGWRFIYVIAVNYGSKSSHLQPLFILQNKNGCLD